MYKDHLEPVITHFTSERYIPEFTKAQNEYFRITGKVFEDEPMFESRTTAFLEWYLLDRMLSDVVIPPIRLYYLIYREKMTEEEERELFHQFQRTTHSLFELVGKSGQKLTIKDLYDGKIYKVSERRTYVGVEKGDLVDTRIVAVRDQLVLSDAIWLHPAEVKRFILAEVERVRKEGRERFQKLLFDLAYMKLKKDRYRHIEAEQIYTWATVRNDRKEVHA